MFRFSDLLTGPLIFIEPPVINFTQSVYNVNEGRKAVIGISVTQSEVIAPLTVRYVIFSYA